MSTMNFQELKTRYADETLDQVIPKDTQSIIAQGHDGVYTRIPVSEANSHRVGEYQDYITDLTDIIKAAGRTELLERDLLLLHSKFPRIQVSVYPDVDSFQYILVQFPLPQTFTTIKGNVRSYLSPVEDFLVILTGYPAAGPHGVHIRRNSPNRRLINKALKDQDKTGHIYDEAIGGDLSNKAREELSNDGWDWLCFHYDNYHDNWQFNLRDIKKGDCLAKYFINLHVALSGGFPDEED